MGTATDLLTQVRAGESRAEERLYQLLYDELRRHASCHLLAAASSSMKQRCITLNPASIVHETWLRCAGREPPDNRKQFFAYASKVMRSVIFDYLRAHLSLKRGEGAPFVTLNTAICDERTGPEEVVLVDTALEALQRIDERCYHAVVMRYFGDMTHEEIAAEIGMAVATVKRDLRTAEAFLANFLQKLRT